MTDLNKEREAFERLPLAELAIKSEYVYYNEETNSYWPNEDFCPSDAPETMNFAWEAWQEKAKAQPVPNQIINEIQAWIAKESFMSYEAFDGLFVVGANEIAEFIEQLVKSESGAEG